MAHAIAHSDANTKANEFLFRRPFASIDRDYSARKADAKLGFRCQTGFAEVLAGLT